MDFRFTAEQEEFRKSVCKFLDEHVTREVIKEIESGLGWFGPACKRLFKELGNKKWLAAVWPIEFGGMGRSYIENLILFEEMAYRRGPRINIGITMVGPTIFIYGSDEQKKNLLPRIAKGEIEFALGYSEPEAGSDLAALETRAILDNDYYIINGQKMFSTASHFADFHWLAARTDPSVERHRGISIFIVDLKSPGIHIQPLWCMDGIRTNMVYYDNVRVPRSNLVGKENHGWSYMGAALAFERVTTFTVARYRRIFDELIKYTKEVSSHTLPENSQQVLKNKLAELLIEFEVGRLFTYRTAWMLDKGIIPNNESASLKIFVTELAGRLANVGMEVLSLYGQLQRDSKWALLEGRVENLYLATVMPKFGAGGNEILRNLIAIRGLGLPR